MTPVDNERAYRASLGAAMASRRRELEQTQEQVARAIDVPYETYRMWERGKAVPRGVAWLRLCQHFNWPHPLLTGESSLSIDSASDLLVYRRTPLRGSETLVGVS